MTVSVVVPAYNEERFITPCLRSLLDQDQPFEEIIVVDNNSRDRTAEMARACGVRVLRETRQGQSPARNRGFDEARGQIIARVDADTIVPPGWARRVRAAFDGGRIDAVTGPTVFYDISLPSLWSGAHRLTYFRAFRLLCGHHALFGSNMALSRRIWASIRDTVCMDDRNLHEDMDVTFHIREAGGRVRFDPELQATISARRIRKPQSLLVEYPYRFVTTIRKHKGFRWQ